MDTNKGAKPKVYKEGQYTDPAYKKLSKINGEINKLSKQELQTKLKECGLDTRYNICNNLLYPLTITVTSAKLF